jgi:hypothetical protein
LTDGTLLNDVSKAVDNVFKETDKWFKDAIRNNYAWTLAAVDLGSELGRFGLKLWLGEGYEKGKGTDSK